MGRAVERAVRRVVRGAERAVRDTVHIAGDLVTGGSFTQKELAEKQAKAEEEARAAEQKAYEEEQQRIKDEEKYQQQIAGERVEAESKDNNAIDETGVGLGDVEVTFQDALRKNKKRNKDSLKDALMN